jgi:hypothetical protein
MTVNFPVPATTVIEECARIATFIDTIPTEMTNLLSPSRIEFGGPITLNPNARTIVVLSDFCWVSKTTAHNNDVSFKIAGDFTGTINGVSVKGDWYVRPRTQWDVIEGEYVGGVDRIRRTHGTSDVSIAARTGASNVIRAWANSGLFDAANLQARANLSHVYLELSKAFYDLQRVEHNTRALRKMSSVVSPC